MPSGVSRVTLKWAGTPGRAGTVLTMAGTSPAARAPLDKALQPKWTLCWGATKVSSASLAPQKLRRTAAQQAAASRVGSTRDWVAMIVVDLRSGDFYPLRSIQEPNTSGRPMAPRFPLQQQPVSLIMTGVAASSSKIGVKVVWHNDHFSN